MLDLDLTAVAERLRATTAERDRVVDAGRAWAAEAADLTDLEWLAETEPTTQVPGRTWQLSKDDVPTLVAALPEDREGWTRSAGEIVIPGCDSWFEPFVDGALEVWAEVAPVVYDEPAFN